MKKAGIPKKPGAIAVTRAIERKLPVGSSSSGHGETDGVVAKRLDGPYTPGERTMIKVKRLRTADCVVGGFRYESRSREVGSLLLGLYDNAGRLNHVGFTSTITGERTAGIDEAPRSIAGGARIYRKSSRRPEPLEHRAKRRMGAASARTRRSRCATITSRVIRFRHGTKLMRWRPDKDPHQCTCEQIEPPLADVKA